MSQITGAGVNEAIIGEIKKIKDPGTAQIVSAIVGAAAAKAVGGDADAGAAAAASGTKNNLYEKIPAIRQQLEEQLITEEYESLPSIRRKRWQKSRCHYRPRRQYLRFRY